MLHPQFYILCPPPKAIPFFPPSRHHSEPRDRLTTAPGRSCAGISLPHDNACPEVDRPSPEPSCRRRPGSTLFHRKGFRLALEHRGRHALALRPRRSQRGLATVTPAKAGVQAFPSFCMPACAGMPSCEVKKTHNNTLRAGCNLLTERPVAQSEPCPLSPTTSPLMPLLRKADVPVRRIRPHIEHNCRDIE